MSAEIKTYLESQGLSEAMTAAVKQVITERPANAQQRLSELLLESASTWKPYTLYYNAKGTMYYARLFAPVAILEEVGGAYTIKDADEKPGGNFFLPALDTPKGAQISQVAAIMYTLGHELGLAPAKPTDDIKALQACNDIADMITESTPGGEGAPPPKIADAARKKAWLDHFEKLMSPEHALNYADFTVMSGFALCIIFGAFTLDDLPAGLKAWYGKIKGSKGVTAALAKQPNIVPGAPCP